MFVGGTGSPTVSIADSVFEGNYAWNGAGMFVSSGFQMTVDRTVFVDNVVPRFFGTVTFGGGAELSGDGDAVFSACNFTGNYAFNAGGGACGVSPWCC